MPRLPFAIGVLHVSWSFLLVTIAVIVFPMASLAEAPNYLVTVWCIIYSARGSTGLSYITECLLSLYAVMALSVVQFAFVNRIGFQTVLVYPILRTCTQLTTNYRNMRQSRGAFLDAHVSAVARIGIAEEASNVSELLSRSAPPHMIAALIRRRQLDALSRSSPPLGHHHHGHDHASSTNASSMTCDAALDISSSRAAARLVDFLIDPVTLTPLEGGCGRRQVSPYSNGPIHATDSTATPTGPTEEVTDNSGRLRLLLLFCHVGFFDSPLDAATCQPWRLQSEKLLAVLQRIVNSQQASCCSNEPPTPSGTHREATPREEGPSAANSNALVGGTPGHEHPHPYAPHRHAFIVRATATLFVIAAVVPAAESATGRGGTADDVFSDMEGAAGGSSSSWRSRSSTSLPSEDDAAVASGPPAAARTKSELHKAVHTAFIDTLSGEYPFTILAEVSDPHTGGCVGCIPGEARLAYDVIGPDVTRAMQRLLEMITDARTFGGVWMSPSCSAINLLRDCTPSNAATKSINLSKDNFGEAATMETTLVRAA